MVAQPDTRCENPKREQLHKLLAMRAEMCAALRHYDARNGRAALPARLSRAPENLEFLLKAAGRTARPAVILQAAPAEAAPRLSDACRQHLPNGVVQGRNFGRV